MKFCPKCDIRLKKIDSNFKCSTCGYTENTNGAPKQKEEKSEISDFNILDQDEGKEALPTIKKDCEKCGHDEAVWWMLQTRSADEPTTQFYRCVKCSHTWRDYS
ncbi:MAG: transcription factor S [Cenarchaeum symbiont of Oopsacas minuta]|nr:transcription factor S [Cenarchaeum symbiont of Oopsacas minuta]